MGAKKITINTITAITTTFTIADSLIGNDF